MQLKSGESIKSILQRSHPIVIKSTQVNLDSHDSLINQYASEIISVLKRPKQLTNAAGHGTIMHITIKQYFDEFAAYNKDPDYDWIILHELATSPKLRQHILAEEFINQFPKSTSYRLWVTPQHSFTGAHFDSCETFNLQLFGQKKFILYPPGTRRYKARSSLSRFGHTSEFNDFETAEQTSAWKKILNSRIEFILQPGDMIYIPPGWWHQVYNQNSTSINVLINFSAGKKLLKHPYILFDLMLKALLNKK